jgi:hypothetical protein
MKISVVLKVPQKILDAQGVIRSIENAQKTRTAPDVKRLFKKTTEGWHNKPSWQHKQTTTHNRIGIEIFSTGPNSDQYALVNAGSGPHPIVATNSGGWLRFQPGYRSATRPRILASHAYSRFGNYIAARSVNHPGFKAREFDQAIADHYRKTFADDMQDAVDSVVRNP